MWDFHMVPLIPSLITNLQLVELSLTNSSYPLNPEFNPNPTHAMTFYADGRIEGHLWDLVVNAKALPSTIARLRSVYGDSRAQLKPSCVTAVVCKNA